MRPPKNAENETPSETYWKSSDSMHGSSDSQFFRTTTEIQSEPETFYESGYVMTFLTILGVTELSCSFRLVLDEKTGKQVKLKKRWLSPVYLILRCCLWQLNATNASGKVCSCLTLTP